MSSGLSDSELRRLRSVVNIGSQELPLESIKGPIKQEVPKKEKPATFTKTSADSDAQLFVKVEEHEAVGNDLHKARDDIKTIASTIELLAKAEKLKAEAIDRMEQHIANFDNVLAKIESRVIPPNDILAQGMDGSISISAASEIGDLNQDLKNLKDALSKLK